NIAQVRSNNNPQLNDPMFYNNQRVIGRTLNDGLTPPNTYTWAYRYGTPKYNALGAVRIAAAPSSWQHGNHSVQSYPNSAVLYYNAFVNTQNKLDRLVHPPLREFRGHDVVLETDPAGAQTEHWFYQGEAVDAAGVPTRCIPNVTGPNITSDACIKQLQAGEFLKGKEY